MSKRKYEFSILEKEEERLQQRPYVTLFPFGRLTKVGDRGWRESEARRKRRKGSQGQGDQGEQQRHRPDVDKEGPSHS